ncbi:MAG TPA: sigma-54 dependent transcriptional regulator [candidate division Zixibacteria bacterium]|nr:sigma-54-dependent Fis family transcriptional regulator [candidate division Zixibacteria bacterium]MDD4917903.1 sigma-54 dependent transcriptional regulator [candidate division Zixibacteria bacterium]MDM7972020.1 sigma-54 dependent transcriptional regulator [candidate division Zixibacteria bacterium]HOD66213.1 sigma-54 dependent transcriptional regulator [candidate division Zixibacteria bacterium]HPC10950.1 sigma-54 dependent transcriptional regulator [candidate division Zixibacteria bacteri
MPNILVVDDKDSMRNMLAETLSEEGHRVDAALDGRSAIDLVRNKSYDLVLTDLKMPDISGLEVLTTVKEVDSETAVIVMTAYGTIEDAVAAMKAGAYDFITKPFDTEHLCVLINRALENRRLMAENTLLREEAMSGKEFANIIGKNHQMAEVCALVQKVAGSDASVLLQGESGTGKELFARAIHGLSSRANGPYITINCAAIPRELLENELFGSEKGAFTGAHARKMGKFEIANTGTIFLDEIGDMDIALQAKLLRVLQQRNFERLGGTKPIEVDVRVIAATNMDLTELIRAKRFREDLYYRLSVFPLTIPPLRERLDDLPLLADFFIAKYCTEMRKPVKSLTRPALELLQKYHWPGNVRELENTIERAVILAEGKKITPDHLAIRLRRTSEIQLRDGAGLKEIGALAQMQAERSVILRVLKDTRGNKRKAARILKIDYTTLFDKIKKYDIESALNE